MSVVRRGGRVGGVAEDVIGPRKSVTQRRPRGLAVEASGRGVLGAATTTRVYLVLVAILLGTVVNNPIVLVDQARALRAENPGLPASEAVQQAVASRLRPIAMTTLTTICGLLPLVLLPGEGSELYRGVGAIVLAGLVGAALVTLVFLPPLLAFAIDVGDRLAGRRVAMRGAASTETP
ncbi:efflux RND transporter permease subunit [Methylibium sp.]|uniref:efflux RND transporter permease subunit n=1 Tax=Methylibium sp. TaxID=2067992 RepID=UPI0017D1B786|nr:efflux RND transporter permease subunit [Methylibium sp.]MBA3591874.1 efflux RND transporter permease subunit [Methylibium sp.]